MKLICFVAFILLIWWFFREKLHLHLSQLQTQGLIRSLVSSHPLSNILTNFCTFLFLFLKRGKWSLTVIRIYDRFYVNMMQRVKKIGFCKNHHSVDIFLSIEEFSRIRATFTKITHTFEKESKKKMASISVQQTILYKTKVFKINFQLLFFSLKSNIWRLFQESFKNIFDLIFSLNFFFHSFLLFLLFMVLFWKARFS